MRNRLLIVVGAVALGISGVLAVPIAGAAEPSPDGQLTVFEGTLTSQQFAVLAESGLDRQEISVAPGGAAGRVRVEVVITSDQAAKLSAAGVDLQEKAVDGTPVSSALARQAAKGFNVFRSYSEPGGIQDELTRVAAHHPKLVKLVVIGQSVRGQDIVALKVTKNARKTRDGSRPAVLYSSAQHAREWITPEMTRRLLHHYVNAYSTNPKIHRIVNTTELWFLPVANPDGYDFTFTQGNRLWRKNLRDINGDGVITSGDGVDPNRNFPTKWGYDNEGSSPATASETYRGSSPASEPETRAFDGLLRRVGFEYLINYHSAAELLLYGVGWQVATPSPDDQIYEALLGDDANPAVPGYDPDISAELYTTNGETDDNASTKYGTLAITPEMSTCQTASAVDPNDAYDPADCASVFTFPDSKALVRAEYQKNMPLAVAVAKSAKHPDHPVSPVGLKAPNFDVDSFKVSYGDPQPVAVTARRSLRHLRLHYSIDGGQPQRTRVHVWPGGERYGDTGNNYYAEFRGTVQGADVGDQVKVWFTGRAHNAAGQLTQRSSHAFRYRLAEDSNADVLVIANEDYEGVNPTYPASVTSPKYAAKYVNALKSKGISSTVWDVSARGVPNHLGVLDHFGAAIWYLGDNRLTQDPSDEITDLLGNGFPDASVAERQQYLTVSVRDYLNGGGKLLHTGETAGYFGSLGTALGGIYYGLDGAPEEDCVVTSDPFSDCLLLADDFTQYYLGGYSRSTNDSPNGVNGFAAPFTGTSVDFGGGALPDNPLDEAGSFAATSDLLPVSEFPQFDSHGSATYQGGSGGIFAPVDGDWYVGALHTDDTYTRLGGTVDLTGTSAAQSPSLDFALSYDVERRYDNVIVEAHTVGKNDWTTLAETGGLTKTRLPAECGAGFLIDEHPFLEHYLTPGRPCQSTGTTGSWNRMTGNSHGWQQVSFDLSDYAGKRVKVFISYVTDPFTGGPGVFVDDTRINVDGSIIDSESFETGLGSWTIKGAPAGSPEVTVGFRRAQSLFSAAVTTPDSVLLGFGVEQLATKAERAAVLGKVMNYLLPYR